MAYKGPKYQTGTSLVDFVNPMATAEQSIRAKYQQEYDNMLKGVDKFKELGGIIGDAVGYVKRKQAIQYLGDAKLTEMKKELAALKTELETVDNQMRTIKAEDKNSFDVNQDLNVPAETDVNAFDVNGGRMATYPINTPYGTQDASMMKVGTKALGGF